MSLKDTATTAAVAFLVRRALGALFVIIEKTLKRIKNKEPA